jgi:hypothetical protein
MRDEIIGGWKKVHNDELLTLHCSSNIIRMTKSRRMRWTGHAAGMGAKRNAYRILVGKPEVKTPLPRSKCRWGDNIKMDLGEIGRDGRDWIDLAQDKNQ